MGQRGMVLYLVHHAQAVESEVDPQRPLSREGMSHAAHLAATARAAGCVPAAIWHSGKLRARQTAAAFHRACNPMAAFKMVRGLRPDDSPELMRTLVMGQPDDLLLVGHMPNVRLLLRLLDPEAAELPLHGLVALQTGDDGATWVEQWRSGR